ncbi:MAG: sensor histidine kinase [Promethearchaeota archaeon]|jgi:signal transduction histidine kinase
MGRLHDPFSHFLHMDLYEFWRVVSLTIFILSISIIVQNSINKFRDYRIILIGTLLIISFWFIEAFFHTIIFNTQSSYIDNLLFPPAHEFWMRFIVLLILTIFSVLTQTIINKMRDMHKTLLKVENDLRESYNNSKFYKDLFTHDINNIFNVINSSAELISNYYNNPKKDIIIEEYPELIKYQIDRGSKLIGNVQKLYELEEIELNLGKLEILDILNQAISYVKHAYIEKNIRIILDLPEEELHVIANKLLKDVFENILINAIKHNKNPIKEIFIKISKEFRYDKEFVKMEFKDNGFGITDEKKKIIFEKDNRKYKGPKGMGLGLSLVKKITDNNCGEIWVENRVKEDYSKGSNFVIVIPIAP